MRSGDLGMLVRQTVHEFAALVREPVILILSVGFPLVFFLLILGVTGNPVIDDSRDLRMVQFLAPGMAGFGVAMATFSFLAVGLAEARAHLILKRQTSNPVPPWVLIGGRIAAALMLAAVAMVLVLAAGVAFHGLQVPAGGLLTLVVGLAFGAVSFAALGLMLALALPSPQLTLAVTNGIVIPLAFISDMFFVGGEMPELLSRAGSFFPLKHVVQVLSAALDPSPGGGGIPWASLGVLALWGAAAAGVAGWLMTRGEGAWRSAATGPEPVRRDGRPADVQQRRPGRPTVPVLLGHQIGHTAATQWRDAGSVFFAVAFPVLLVVIIPMVNGGGDLRLDSGATLGLFYAATMAIYGAAVTAYVNVPQVMAEDREKGVLKRVRATPLPLWLLVLGRVIGALFVAVLTLLVIAAGTAALYRPGLPTGWPMALLVLVVSAIAFCVIGLAVASIARTAQSAIGMSLGTLLPLCFVSDIFVIGAKFPTWLDTISWVFPLRHASRAMTDAVTPEVELWPSTGLHLLVLLAWTIGAALLLSRTFRTEPGGRPTAAEHATEPSGIRQKVVA